MTDKEKLKQEAQEITAFIYAAPFITTVQMLCAMVSTIAEYEKCSVGEVLEQFKNG